MVGGAEPRVRNAMGWLRGRQHAVQDGNFDALHSDQGWLAMVMSHLG